MDMIEVRTSDLVGAALDWAVAHAIGHKPRTGHGCAYPVEIIDWNRPGSQVNACRFEPSTDWSQGGPLIKKNLIAFSVEHKDVILAVLCDENGMYISGWRQGENHLIAACRAIVAAKLGDAVQVPSQLVEGKA